MQWTARELTHHCSHGTRCERTAEGEILKSGNGKVGNESIPCGFSNLFFAREKISSIAQHTSHDFKICFDFGAIFGKGNNLKTLKQLVCVVFVAITHKLIHTQWKFNNGTS